MSAFQESKSKTEKAMMLELLKQVESNPSVSQRTLSQEMGIAFGLVNRYFQRCIAKGWLKVKTVSPKRYLYFVTPEGIAEKSKMVRDYLSDSFKFLQMAQEQCIHAFEECEIYNWQKIALLGKSELADIAFSVSKNNKFDIDILPVDKLDNICDFDAVMVTDIDSPQATYDALCDKIHKKKIIVLDMLHITT